MWAKYSLLSFYTSLVHFLSRAKSPSNAALRIRESAVKWTRFGKVDCLRRVFVNTAFGAACAPSSDVIRPPAKAEYSFKKTDVYYLLGF